MSAASRIRALRRQIDDLDQQIVSLLSARAACAREIGEAKDGANLQVFDPAREEQVLRRIAGINQGPLTAAGLSAIYREIISACRALERPVSVAYWGPPASNTHLAAEQRFGPEGTFLPMQTVADVFGEVERGKAHYGVVPVENSTEGIVSLTLDMFLDSPLQVCAEIYVEIHHYLLSRASSLREVRRIYTMPQATAQCQAWLRRQLPGVELVDVTTTARAAQIAAGEPDAAAIANRAAAEEYGLNVLAEEVEDNPRNRTRFLVIGEQQPAATGRDKTSILFSVRHEPGALARALHVLEKHGISLTMIASRPTKLTPWEYVFFIDVQGHAADPEDKSRLLAALPEFEARCLFVRILGSYPEA
jgi:chorismate mutase/prephenate dehydratase